MFLLFNCYQSYEEVDQNYLGCKYIENLFYLKMGKMWL